MPHAGLHSAGLRTVSKAATVSQRFYIPLLSNPHGLSQCSKLNAFDKIGVAAEIVSKSEFYNLCPVSEFSLRVQLDIESLCSAFLMRTAVRVAMALT